MLLVGAKPSSAAAAATMSASVRKVVVGMVCSPFCAVSGAPVSAGGAVNRVRVGGQPRRVRAERSRVFGPRSPARSALGELA